MLKLNPLAMSTAAVSDHLPLAAGEEAIITRDLNVFYGSFRAVKDVNLTIPRNKITAMIGPSGCGKSTLLRLIGGLDSPTAGAITLDDEVVRAHDDSTAIAFQEPRLLPWRTIAQATAFSPLISAS